MTRVITDKGFGEILPIEFNPLLYALYATYAQAKVKVSLDEFDCLLHAKVKVYMERKDVLGWRQDFIRRDVYEFGEYMIIRITDTEGMGMRSKIMSFGQPIIAHRIYSVKVPPNETRLLLNLATGQFEVTDLLDLLTNQFMHIQAWIDLLDQKQNYPPSYNYLLNKAVSRFDGWERSCVGTSGGILARVLLDMEKMRILRFAIAATANRGVVFSKHF